MAMDGIEYSKGLSRAREDYHNKVREFKENTEQEVKNLNRLHEQKEKKQQETFINAKEKLDKDYEAQLNSLSNRSAQNLHEKQELFSRRLAEEQANFNQNRKQIKADFDRRLGEVSNSYDANVKNMELSHELDKVNTKAQAENVRYNQERKHAKEIAENNQRTEDAQAQTVENFKESKRKLVQQQANRVNDINNQNADRNFRKSLQQERQLQSVVDAKDNEFNSYKRNKENSEKVLKQANAKALEDLVQNYDMASARGKKAQKEEMEKVVEDFVKRDLNAKKQFAEEKADLQRTIHNLSDQSTDSDGAAKNVRDALQAGYETRDKARQKQMLEMQESFDRDQKNAQKQFNLAAEDRKRDNQKTMENKDRQFSDYVSASNFRHNMDKEKLIANYDERNLNESKSRLKESLAERGTFKRTQAAQSKNFADTINRMSDDNAQLLDMTRSVLNKEKKDAIENSKKEQAELTTQMLREQEFKLSNQADGYKDRLDAMDNQMKLTQSQLEDRLAKMRENRSLDLSFQEQKHSEMREEDWNTMKENLRLKTIENDLKIKEMQRDNRNFIQKMSRGFQNKMNETVTSYESQIRQLHADYGKKLASKTQELRNSQKQMKVEFDQQKAIMEGQHNDEMQKIKSVYEDEIMKLRNANKGLA